MSIGFGNIYTQQKRQGAGAGGNKQPSSWKVGTTPGAPAAGTSTFTNAGFANNYASLFIGSLSIPSIDPGGGQPYFTKTLASNTIIMTNYLWGAGDIITVVLS